MSLEQVANLWAFVRGDTDPLQFERWLFAQPQLENILGSQLHSELLFADYRDQDAIWTAKTALKEILALLKTCECPTLKDLSVVPMGGEGLDERVFATLEQVVEHGGAQWWLYASKCSQCGQAWMIAQDERIHDNFYLKRIEAEVLSDIIAAARWPDEFATYEQVLRLGRQTGHMCRFADSDAPALAVTVVDLQQERPDIGANEIAELLNIPIEAAMRLLTSAANS